MSGRTEGPEAAPFRVGEWTADPEANVLRREGAETAVEPRVMRLLAHLASRPGRVVSRRELIEAVWEGVVVGEGSIHRAVWALREALGDDPRRPRYIETIRKGGYRLIAPVEPEGGAAGRKLPRRTGSILLLLAAAAAAALVLLIPRGGGDRREAPSAGVFLDGVPVTSSPGRELFPHLSPDGRRAVFSRDGDGSEPYDLYVKKREGGGPVRLTEGPEDDVFPRWSPDGETVLFVRAAEDSHRLATIPAAGGPVRILLASASPIRDPDWSPGGDRIAFSVWDAATHAFRLRLFDPATGDLLEPVPPEPGATSDLYPRFSPGGGRIAFIRVNALGFYRVMTAPSGGGEGRLAATGRRGPSGLAWMPGGKELLVTAAPVGPVTLWRIDLRDGSMTGMAARNRRIWSPSVSRDGEVLLYATGELRADVVRAPAADPAAEAAPLIRSTCVDGQPRYSPAGDRIAFISDRSGAPEVWLADRRGAGATRLTFFDGAYVFHPFWNPAGDRIGFNAGGPRGVDAYVIDAEGGKPILLAGGPGHDAAVSWSRDGRWIYLVSDRDGAWRIWKTRPDGSGAVRVSGEGALRAEESPDGRLLYTLSLPALDLRRAPVAGGPADTLLPPASFDPSNWTVRADGLYFLRGDGDETRLVRLDPETGEEETLRPAPNAQVNSISLSPDGTELLYARYEQREADLMAVEDFR